MKLRKLKGSRKIGFWGLLLVFFACGTPAKDPYKDCTRLDEIDASMLKKIKTIESKYADDASFLEKFKMEQVYWIQYRDRRIRALYPKKWDLYYRKEYGRETFNNCKCIEMVRLTGRRLEDLAIYLDAVPSDQQGCPIISEE